MQSSIITRDGLSVTKTRSINGSNVSSVVVTQYYHKTDVTNGLVQGDRKRKVPNPFKFSYVKSGWGWSSTLLTNAAYGSYAYQDTQKPFLAPGYASTALQYTSIDDARVKNAAMAKIYDQLRGNNNLIVDLAESSSTIKMFKNILNLKKFIGEFISEVIKHPEFIDPSKSKRVFKHKGQRIYWRDTPRSVSSPAYVPPRFRTDQYQKRLDYVAGKWLESRYGWLPLVNSIYDAADNLNRDLIERFVTVEGKSGVRIEIPSKPVNGPNINTKAWLSEYFCSYRCKYSMFFSIPGGPKLSDWTSLNPIGIAYELMTLSFVIDWVADIGGYLSLWENNALFAKHFVKGTETMSYKEYYTYHERYRESSPFVFNPSGSLISGFNNVGDASSYSVRAGLDRKVLTSLPTPPSVTVKVRFGSLHQLDSIALFHQLIAKKARG